MLKKFFIFILIVPSLLISCAEKEEARKLEGSLYTNDCGSARCGFEWAGEYRATLEIFDDVGTLYLKQIAGLGDPLREHNLKVEDFKINDSKIEMKINGIKATLIWTEKDKIWDGEYNFHYIGNNSQNPYEKIGSLSPSSFPGLLEHFYVELRLKKIRE